jgi:ribonuclease HI
MVLIVMRSRMKAVVIYVDGAAEPNPGAGGYGVVLIHENHRKELSGGFLRTTNNRMEIIAAIKGLEALKTPCAVKLYSDSQYVVKAITNGWAKKWQAKGWRRNQWDQVVNADLWDRLMKLCATHQVQFEWVKGHAGNRENERCDALAMKALQNDNLAVDTGYAEKPERSLPVDGEVCRSDSEPRPTRKITTEGQHCRKCSTPVIKRSPRRKPKPGQEYYYEYYLYCPHCHNMYMVEDAKRRTEQQIER